MFKKILIANRGEIAVRIMATCREMGIRTVAIYSDVDRFARHVREADEAYYVGPAAATQSYLRIDNIIRIARESGAEAIHPGYGFLSENATFVEECEKAGLVFIGPPASAMRLMGSKISAKHVAQEVGAPTVPGYSGSEQDEETLLQEARHIGFPLLIKASAGGGGKGMRVVYQEADFLEQAAGARREALAAFGDETVFLERYLQQPRHIEIQVLGDTYGNLIYLGERECSIQRRHQKILEESPSVALTPALRDEMGQTAVRIAKAAGYVNAGTLEFMLDEDMQFYFLEMNTRLQVEHPVTELITGLDLVHHQIMIAAGVPLALTQEQITTRGHAIEVRIYAEDAQQHFLPSTGTVTNFILPQGPGIRVDNGIESGDEITQYYDPMIAKLIVYGEDRPTTISRLQCALEQSALFGVTTNISLLYTISRHPAFKEGLTFTNFLEANHLLDQEAIQLSVPPSSALIAAAIYDIQKELSTYSAPQPRQFASPPAVAQNPWQILGPWRMAGEARIISYTFTDNGYKISLSPGTQAVDTWNVEINGEFSGEISYRIGHNGQILVRQGTSQFQAYVQNQNGETLVAFAAQTYHLQRRQPPEIDHSTHGSAAGRAQKALTAPMAGTIVKVHVQEGDLVDAHQVLVILSAMKMEHSITAPYEGRVRKVPFQEGTVVKGGAVVVEME